MTFDEWWEDFVAEHDDWKYADSKALRHAAFQAGAAIRDAEVARLREINSKLCKKSNWCVVHTARLEEEVARLEQENDQLSAQIKQKDAEIADLLEANRIACEDLVEQQNLRVKYAGQIAELVAALEHILAGSLSLPRFAEAEAIAVIAKVRKP